MLHPSPQLARAIIRSDPYEFRTVRELSSPDARAVRKHTPGKHIRSLRPISSLFVTTQQHKRGLSSLPIFRFTEGFPKAGLKAIDQREIESK